MGRDDHRENDGRPLASIHKQRADMPSGIRGTDGARLLAQPADLHVGNSRRTHGEQ